MTPSAFSEGAKDVVRQATPAAVREEGYYGLPMLKRPLWGWEIALYFFSEGISSGSYIIATMAELFGSARYASTIRHARYVSLAMLLPCPPLLIADLGRPERFHHMLRIVKRHSPMSVGAWALTGYSQPVAVLALKQFASLGWIPARVTSALGLPFAFVMLAYPGVLLSTTSIPIWARTRLLGALLGASSMASAASALSICAALDPSSEDTARAAIQRIELAAHTVEALALAGYVYTEGAAARPLLRGRYSKMFRFGAFAAGIVLPAIVTMARPKHSRSSALVSGALSIAGALALKWSIVHAGHDSAIDGAINRDTTRATATRQGWLPSTDVRTGVLAGR